MPNISFNDVSVIYTFKKNEEKVALNHLHLFLSTGKIHALIGYSGSGKTTLLKTLYSGVPYEGEIKFDDINIDDIPIKDRQLAYVSQNYALYPHMTVFDNIAFPLKIMGASSDEIKERVYEVAKELDISICLSRKPKHLSGGQQQRVALARALIKNPSLCILDEPLSNLDSKTSYLAKELIIKCLQKRNVTAIYVTHDLSEATSIGEEIHVINDGEIIFNGNAEELLNSKDPRIISLTAD